MSTDFEVETPDWDDKWNRQRALKAAFDISAVLGGQEPRRLGTLYLENTGAEYLSFHAVRGGGRAIEMAGAM